jgi:hypothetical protein
MRRSGMLRDRLKRFAQARRGAVGVEFAFLALPSCSCCSRCWSSRSSSAVGLARHRHGGRLRQIRTGNFQRDNGTTGAASQNAFKGLVCRKMMWLATGCDTALQIDVRRWEHTSATSGQRPTTWATLTSPRQTPHRQDDAEVPRPWSPRAAKDIVLVARLFHWAVADAVLSQPLQSAEGGHVSCSRPRSVDNEPY